MYVDTLEHFAKVAEAKAAVVKDAPMSFLIGAMMAGIYVGFGIILIFSVGAFVDESIRGIVMGATFGIALTLVTFAGSELFTGHTMYMTVGWLHGRTTLRDLLAAWLLSWFGNLAGAVILSVLFFAGGFGVLLKFGGDLLYGVMEAKLSKTGLELFALGILCNWLVCLALWIIARIESDTAKCIVIFWCLLAFIASGFEHSVANMTLFAVALLGPHPETLSFGGVVHNLFWVSAGNAIAGSVFVALGYWWATSPLVKR